MAIIQGNAKQGSTQGFYPKVINGSLRFNDDDSAYLSWTPASSGDSDKFTMSFWIKRCKLGTTQYVMNAGNGSVAFQFRFGTDDKLDINQWNGSAYTLRAITNMVFRDTSAWYHIVFSFNDTDNISDVYVNGELQSLSTDTAPSADSYWNNSSYEHRIGRGSLATGYLDAYLANMYIIDGQALTADDFGETKNGVWVAKDYAGTFGTNGFYLTFEDDTQVEAFNTVLYRGNGGTQSITGVGFQPDLVWIKDRTLANSNWLVDSVRGVGYELSSNQTIADYTTYTRFTSFDSDGFSVSASGSNQLNQSASQYTAWCWKAGDSNVSNTDGTITSTVRANDTYGFSIVSWTADGSDATIGHGLSTAPQLYITKARNTTGNWNVYTTLIDGSLDFLKLNLTDAKGDSGRSAPTSTVINMDYPSGTTAIAYCWSETTGYSKFGSYTGDSTTDGSNAITCGFKPAWVMIKRYDSGSAERWNIFDNTREVTNPADNYLAADTSNAEGVDHPSIRINFEDNGFSLAGNNSGVNQTGGTYIYAAFADTREAAFWLDQSGNDNDWQPVNLDHNDTVADSPTDNHCTLNPLDNTGVLSDGNLRFAGTADSTYRGARATFALPSTGMWYWENKIEKREGARWNIVGMATSGVNLNAFTGNVSGAIIYGSISGTNRVLYNETTLVSNSATIDFDVGDVIQCAYDADTGKFWFGKNNAWWDSSVGTTGDPATGANPTLTVDTSKEWFPFVQCSDNNNAIVTNFGQQPFKYDPPA